MKGYEFMDSNWEENSLMEDIPDLQAEVEPEVKKEPEVRKTTVKVKDLDSEKPKGNMMDKLKRTLTEIFDENGSKM
jgi:hypothetical protein